jgi:LysR family transcriptional regulator of gallate degradation
VQRDRAAAAPDEIGGMRADYKGGLYCETGNYSWAARNLGVSRPSIHRAINDIERISGLVLFERTAHGYATTPAGEALRRSAKLALAELRQGLEEIDAYLGNDKTTITVGSLPLARSFILPAAINAFTSARPEVQVRVRDGAYGDLLHGLRYGEIDLVIGALRNPAPIDDVVEEALFLDRLVIAARFGHPLAKIPEPDVQAISRFPWVTPSPTIPTRKLFDALFDDAGVAPPQRIVETSSLILTRGLLLDSDRLTIISRHQIARELENGSLVALDFNLATTDRAIGITTRKDWTPTATQAEFLGYLSNACANL